MNYIATQDALSKLIQDNLTNGKFAYSAAASLLGVHHSSVINGCGFANQKLAQTMAEQGFDACGIQNEGFCAKSFWLTLEYFAYESKAKAPGAKQLARTFGQIGVMTAFEKLEAKAPEPKQIAPDWFDRLAILQKSGLDSDPILRSLMTQRIAESIGQPRLEEQQDDLVLCTVLASELGFTLKTESQGSQLGKWVRKHHEPKGQSHHGKYAVNVYSRKEIKETVKAFFR